jgi:hypothetical protein
VSPGENQVLQIGAPTGPCGIKVPTHMYVCVCVCVCMCVHVHTCSQEPSWKIDGKPSEEDGLLLSCATLHPSLSPYCSEVLCLGQMSWESKTGEHAQC